jgi:hypothetical protein
MMFRFYLLVLLPLAAMPAGALAQSPAETVPIDGFHAAKFGMSEVEVLRAIKSDFSIANDAVTQTINTQAGTHLFKITVQNLLPHSGQAVVTYSFGYRSDKLKEIDVTWDVNDPGNTPAMLLHTGTAIQTQFLSKRFAPGSVTSNAMLTNGNLLLFRGKDAAGHAVALFISGPATRDAATGKSVIAPNDLTVAYAADPAHPDVFKVQGEPF